MTARQFWKWAKKHKVQDSKMRFSMEDAKENSKPKDYEIYSDFWGISEDKDGEKRIVLFDY